MCLVVFSLSRKVLEVRRVFSGVVLYIFGRWSQEVFVSVFDFSSAEGYAPSSGVVAQFTCPLKSVEIGSAGSLNEYLRFFGSYLSGLLVKSGKRGVLLRRQLISYNMM